MKKFLLAVIVGIIMIAATVCSVSADGNEISVYYDAAEVEFDVKPQIINGRTMVPIRAIFEKMGAAVQWDSATNTATCTKGDTVVKMTVNSKDMYINDQLVQMDVEPVVVDGRTLAPARYVAEAFGANVQWSSKNNSVVICSKDVYAYADYPDIPDLGKCYNIALENEEYYDGFYTYTYIYTDMENDDYFSYLYDNSAAVLGQYREEAIGNSDGVLTIAYTNADEIFPKYYVAASYTEDEEAMIFVVMIPSETIAENTAEDTTEITVENKITLYSNDGKTIDVSEEEVAAYLNVGWFKTLEETMQTLYAADGRTVTVFKAEVPACKNVGWYESLNEAQEASKAATQKNKNNSDADGFVYRTPKGKRYHLDPDCGGKNSYRTTMEAAKAAGLTPCSKCA